MTLNVEALVAIIVTAVIMGIVWQFAGFEWAVFAAFVHAAGNREANRE